MQQYINERKLKKWNPSLFSKSSLIKFCRIHEPLFCFKLQSTSQPIVNLYAKLKFPKSKCLGLTWNGHSMREDFDFF